MSPLVALPAAAPSSLPSRFGIAFRTRSPVLAYPQQSHPTCNPPPAFPAPPALISSIGADIKVKEPDFQAMARGKRKFLPPRYMTVRQAAAILLEIGKRRREEGVDTTVTTLSGSTLRVCEPTSLAVAVCRIGMATQLITSGTLEQLARSDCGPPLHSLVLVGETHELEDALLARMAIDAEPGMGPRPAPGDAVGELPPPARATLLEPEDIEVWEIPAAGDPRPGGEASIGAAVVGVPAAAAAAASADAASS